jgi:thiol:disulfide interchange protein
MAHLPQLFVLNFSGFTALAALFWLVRRMAARYLVVVDAQLGLMAVATLSGWISAGRSNPQHLGTLALLVESALIVAVIAHAVRTQRDAARTVR